MATIKHKRGTRAALDASPGLQQGELGLCTDTGELFIGNNGNHPILEQVAAKTLMGNTGSNKALPSAIPAADILEMIGGQAVIQYEVMPATVTEGAVVQYVGEDTVEYVSGSWYRGENGEWVLTSGGGGVYVGSGDMPNGYNVQIDPSGDVLGMGPYAAEDHNHDDVYHGIPVTQTVTLSAANWEVLTAASIQTVAVDGMRSSKLLFVGPTTDSYLKCVEANVYCSVQGYNSLTFNASVIPPEEDLVMQLLWWN